MAFKTIVQELVSNDQGEFRSQKWWLDCKWLETVLANGHKKRLGSVKSESATSPGDNYLSDVVRIKAHVLASDSSEHLGLVLKRSIEVSTSPILQYLSSVAFATETKFYNKIVPKFQEVTRGTVLKGLELWPQCYYASPECILLEDLKVLGFSAPERGECGLVEEDWKLVARSLGHFHALSLVAPDIRVLARQEPPFIGESKAQFLLNAITLLAEDIETHWGKQWKDVGIRVRAKIPIIGKTLQKLASDETPFRVICHGDPWPNNFLIRPATESCPAALKFVDFQLAHYSSYGWDIAYFMGTSGLSWKKLPRFCKSYAEGYLEATAALGYENGPTKNGKLPQRKPSEEDTLPPMNRRTSTPATKLGGILSVKNRRTSAPVAKLVTFANALKKEDAMLEDKSPLALKTKEVVAEVKRLGLFTFASAAIVAPATISKPDKPITLDEVLRDPKAGAHLRSCPIYQTFMRSLLTDLINERIL